MLAGSYSFSLGLRCMSAIDPALDQNLGYLFLLARLHFSASVFAQKSTA